MYCAKSFLIPTKYPVEEMTTTCVTCEATTSGRRIVFCFLSCTALLCKAPQTPRRLPASWLTASIAAASLLSDAGLHGSEDNSDYLLSASPM